MMSIVLRMKNLRSEFNSTYSNYKNRFKLKPDIGYKIKNDIKMIFCFVIGFISILLVSNGTINLLQSGSLLNNIIYIIIGATGSIYTNRKIKYIR